MEQRNEPTTAEIVKALRNCHGTPCETCVMRTGKEEFLCSAEHLADRLEQLERDLETFKAFHERYAQQTSKKYVEDVCALTARAEQAERERDAAVNALTLYEDALFDECDKSYQSGFMDGFQSREEIDDED